MQDYNYEGVPGFGVDPYDDGGSNDLYDPRDYDPDDGDDPPEDATSIDEVIEWLEGQGYNVSRDEFEDEDEEAIDNLDGVADSEEHPLSELEERFVEAYQCASNEAERSQLVLDYNRIKEGLHAHELNMVRAEPYIPQVEEQFEASGLPPAAARDYVQLLLATGDATNPEVQKHAMAMAVGRHTLFDLNKGSSGRASQVQLPGGEVPGGGASLSGDMGSVLESQLKRNFPGIALTPALKRELKEQGIL